MQNVHLCLIQSCTIRKNLITIIWEFRALVMVENLHTKTKDSVPTLVKKVGVSEMWYKIKRGGKTKKSDN